MGPQFRNFSVGTLYAYLGALPLRLRLVPRRDAGVRVAQARMIVFPVSLIMEF